MFLVGLLGVVWWQLSAVLSWSLTQFLQQQGLTNITVEVNDVGLSQALINQLDVTYVEPDTELRLQLKQVRLEYTLSELIKGHAENLLINSAVLKLDHQPNPQTSTLPTLPSIEQLLAAYRAVDPAAFPINTVQLPDISLSHNLASESVTTFDVTDLRADLRKLENQITAKLFFANQHTLHWTSDAKSGWNVQLFDTPAQPGEPQETEQREAVFSGLLNQIDQSLAFSAEMKPGLAQRLALFAKLRDNSIDVAEVTVAGTIKGSQATPGLAILSTIQIGDLEVQNDSIQILNGEFDVQIAQASLKREQSQEPWNLDIKFDNTISLINASFADWRADKVVLSANGDLSLTEDVTKITSSDILLTVGKLQRASELELSDTSFAGVASATIDAEKWQLDLAESWQLTSQYGRLDETELPQGLSLRSTQPLNFMGTFTSMLPADSPSLGKTSLEIAVPVVENTSLAQGVYLGDASLQIDQARFHQGQLIASGSLSIPKLTIVDTSVEPNKKPSQARKQQENDWRLANFNQSFEFENKVFTSRGSMDSVERDLQIETVSKHDFEQQLGDTEFRFKTVKFKEPQRLNQLVSPLVLPVTLVTGELSLSGQARWARKRDQWQATVDIDTQLINLGGAFDETYFSGVNGKLSLQVYPDIVSRKPQRLTITHVDAGVANTDAVVEFTVRPSKVGDLPVVDLLHAQTQLLQGSMHLKPGTYDLNRTQHKLQVVMENIDLSELVRLQQLDDIEATGIVTGQLPVILDNGQVSIDNGKLHAIAPGGTLRYQASTDALQANKYAETVMLALENFNYDVLRADTHYEPDGTLLLKLQLEGNNPDFEQGRQVNLNINLEQNVLKLFESLRLIEGVSDTLDKRVQDFYQQSTSQ